MSATMALLKGKGAAKAAPDKTDEELQPEADGPEEAVAQVADDDEVVGIEDQPDAAVGSDAGVAIPTSKTEVHQLKMADLPGVHEAMGSPVAGFDEMDLKGKKNALLAYLFPKNGPAKSAVSGSDTLTKFSNDIENLKTRADVEGRLLEVIKAEGETAFQKGGLLVKLSEIGDFGEYDNLQQYILANGIAKDYRTARYWMQLYTGLLEIGVPYSEVEAIGWTKILVLLPVLTKENYEEWKAKALAMNVATLQATVDEAQATGNKNGTGAESSNGTIKSMVFKFHQDQTDTANDALAKAKKAAGTESKEVAADLIFGEYLATAPNKASKKVAAPAATVGYDEDNLDVEAFFKAIKSRFDNTPDAMGFLFAEAPEDQQPEGEEGKTWFELLWPEVELSLDIPDKG